jgi:hypothetical protein
MSTLPQGVLEDIYRRLAQLESQAGAAQPGEQLIPNSYSIDAAGNVNLTGLNLPAGTTSTPPNQSRVRWLRTTDGAVVATLYATETGGRDIFQATATATAAANAARMLLAALSQSAANLAAFTLNAAADTGGTSSIGAQAGGQTITLLDDADRSSFLQLAAVGQLALDLGIATLTWTASQTATAIVSHALGRTPQAILTAPHFAPGTANWFTWGASSAGAANFTLTSVFQTAFTGTRDFYWAAIG